MEDKKNKNTASALAIVLVAIVAYIIAGAFFAIPLKYIFFDYFARVGWPTDFSYMTTVMIILGLRFLYLSSIWIPKPNVQSSNNR